MNNFINILKSPISAFRGLLDFKNQKFKLRINIILPIILLIIIGMIALSSKSNFQDFYNSNFYKHIIWILIGIPIFILMQYIRIQYIFDYSYIFYFVLIAILLLTFFFGVDPSETGGAKSWIEIGGFRGQPSEFGKILFICFLSRLLSDINIKSKIYIYLPITAILIFIPLLLLLIQPDLGTAMVYLAIILPLAYWGGVKSILLFLIIAPILSLVTVFNFMAFSIWLILFIFILMYTYKNSELTLLAIILNFILNLFSAISAPFLWELLKPHQQERILTFIDPLRDPFGAGWQVWQSRISIGSGGLSGKGWKNGTQAENNFLPVSDSDFILSTLAEEFGFIMIFIIISILFYFIYWSLIYAQKVNNKFAGLLIVGFLTMISMHMLINLGMISGLLPVTGLPAPFISYGGSFFLSCIIMIGLINNIINNHI